MANATCSKCGARHDWSASRGSRLSDYRSPCCNAPLVCLTDGRPSKHRGQKYVDCVVCAAAPFPRGVRVLSIHAIRPHAPFQVGPRWGQPLGEQPMYPAGSPIHGSHDPVPAGKPRGWPFDHDREHPDADDHEARTCGRACWLEYAEFRRLCGFAVTYLPDTIDDEIRAKYDRHLAETIATLKETGPCPS